MSHDIRKFRRPAPGIRRRPGHGDPGRRASDPRGCLRRHPRPQCTGPHRLDKDRDSYNKAVRAVRVLGIEGWHGGHGPVPRGRVHDQLIRSVVGPKGKVLAYASYNHDKFEERMTKAGLKNVEEMVLEYPRVRGARQAPGQAAGGLARRRHHHPQLPRSQEPEGGPGGAQAGPEAGRHPGIADSRTWTGKRDETNCRIGEDLIIREVTRPVQTGGGVADALESQGRLRQGILGRPLIVDQACLSSPAEPVVTPARRAVPRERGRFRVLPATGRGGTILIELFGHAAPAAAAGACTGGSPGPGCWPARGRGNRRALRRLVLDGPPPGLIGYLGNRPVAWCAIGPRESFPVLERSRVLARVDDRPVWSIPCLFVARTSDERG